MSASQALARTIIPVDPMLIFSNQNTSKARSIAATIRAMTLLLDDRDTQVSLDDSSCLHSSSATTFRVLIAYQDPRPAFEALQALTNLASMGEEVSKFITSLSFSSIEAYLSSTLSAQQQASVELFSNLTVFDACCEMFAVQEPRVPKFPTSYDGTADSSRNTLSCTASVC